MRAHTHERHAHMRATTLARLLKCTATHKGLLSLATPAAAPVSNAPDALRVPAIRTHTEEWPLADEMLLEGMKE